MKNNKWSILIFILGLLIFLYPVFSNWYYETYVNENQIQSLKEKFAYWSKDTQNNSKSDNLVDKDKAYLIKYNEELRQNDMRAYLDPFKSEDDDKGVNIKIDYNSQDIFGIIEIPKINQKLPIYLGASNEHLLKGVALIQGTSLPIGGINTNSVLAAHSGLIQQKLFTDLPELEKGDKIIITNKFEKLTYEVTGNKLIMPDETQYLKVVPNKDMITLLTCYHQTKANDRLIVFAERVSDDPVKTNEASAEYIDEIKVKPSMNVFQIIFVILIILFIIRIISWKIKRKN